MHCEGYDYEQDPEDNSNPLPDPFYTRRMKLLSRPDGFMLYGKLGIDFFSTSDLLYPNMKIKLRLIRARPNFYMISDNPNVSLGIVDCSFYTRRIALKDDYHEKRMDMLAYAPVEYNYLETLAKTFIIPARQNQFIRENIFNNAPIRRIAIAMNINSAFTGSCTDFVDFGKSQDRFGRFSWSKNDSNYLDIKLKVFKREDINAEFRLRQKLSMG